MGNTQYVYFQANRDHTLYKWFKLQRSDVNLTQLDNEVMERFKLDEIETTWTLSFLDTTGHWILLDTAEDLKAMLKVHHGQGTKKSPISLRVQLQTKK